MHCPECGTENADENKFCVKCGKNIENINLNVCKNKEEKSHPVYLGYKTQIKHWLLAYTSAWTKSWHIENLPYMLLISGFGIFVYLIIWLVPVGIFGNIANLLVPIAFVLGFLAMCWLAYKLQMHGYF